LDLPSAQQLGLPSPLQDISLKAACADSFYYPQVLSEFLGGFLDFWDQTPLVKTGLSWQGSW